MLETSTVRSDWPSENSVSDGNSAPDLFIHCANHRLKMNLLHLLIKC